MGSRAWGRRALPVATPLTRDVSTALVSGELSALLACATLGMVYSFDLARGPLYPFAVASGFLVGTVDLWSGSAAFFGLMFLLAVPALAWSLAFGVGVTLLRARHGWNLVFLAAGLGFVSAVVDLTLVGPAWLHAVAGVRMVPTAAAWVAHAVYAAGLLAFPRIYRFVWGGRPRNVYPRRRHDPFDPLGY